MIPAFTVASWYLWVIRNVQSVVDASGAELQGLRGDVVLGRYDVASIT